MKAYVFPGQGAQFTGMGKDLYDHNSQAKRLFTLANDLLGFEITATMFEGTPEDLRQTNITQPAIFLHSVIAALVDRDFRPDMVAGHSLGELSALTANKVLGFEEGLQLVAQRARAMQQACELNPSTMAAILGLEDRKVEQICAQIPEVVVPANYNCPGQVVISGSQRGVEIACAQMKTAGARRALPLAVGGAFHSVFMEPAAQQLAEAIANTKLATPICPIYQNVNGQPSTDVVVIKEQLIAQLTAPVLWQQSVTAMIAAGATLFVESGPSNTLQGLVRKIAPDIDTMPIETR